MWITLTYTYLVYIIAAMLSSEGTAGGNEGGAFSPCAPSCSTWWCLSALSPGLSTQPGCLVLSSLVPSESA